MAVSFVLFMMTTASHSKLHALAPRENLLEGISSVINIRGA